jgi:thymidylate kinase
MLIAFEGVDLAGKSTAAGVLRAWLESHRDMVLPLHFSQPQQHPLAEYELTIDDAQKPPFDHVITDRLHWGECVYPQLYRNDPGLSPESWWHLEQFFRSRGGITIHVTASLEELLTRYDSRGEDYLQGEDVGRARKMFLDIAANAPSLTHTIDTTLPKERQVTPTAVIAAARRRQALTEDALSITRSYVGPHAPDVLLIGDAPNVNDPTYPQHLAAFPPYANSSGSYLIRAVLGMRRYNPWNVGIVNAFERDGSPVDLRALISAFSMYHVPRIVALGKKAQVATKKTGVFASAIAHPQYWRRFHHDAIADYTRLLESM